MKKSMLNLVLDALMLLCLAAIAGIGFLMKFVLVAGYRRWEIYEQNVSLSFFGMDRHQWGEIHFAIGIAFLTLVVLHIILHWSMIVTIYHRLIPSRPVRWVVALIFVFIVIFLFAFSCFVKPEVTEQGRGQGRGRVQVLYETEFAGNSRFFHTKR
jgi:glucan phosphoethanolaminetransferase (alkaline phosphatase superfamily)